LPTASDPVLRADSPYLLQVGDVLAIKFFYNPELNELVTIRPDGHISLQLIDDVQAAGLTPAQLDAVLTVRYAGVLRQAEVSVIVQKYVSQKVYVGGEVNTPGFIPFEGNMTLLQALLHAGGFKETAKMSSVILIRNEGKEAPGWQQVKVDRMLKAEGDERGMLLRPFDVVFVPKTAIATWNQFVEQYIQKLLPVTYTFGFSYFKDIGRAGVPR
jgi:protein involved in polysaccharide export with SLBB domain